MSLPRATAPASIFWCSKDKQIKNEIQKKDTEELYYFITSFQSHAHARIDCIRTYIMFARATALSSSRFSTTSTLGSSFSPSLRRARRHHQQNGRKDCVKTKAAVEPATKKSRSTTPPILSPYSAPASEKKIAILNVKVYAVAMYADKSKLTSDLLNGDFEKEILIQLNMKVEASDFSKHWKKP